MWDDYGNWIEDTSGGAVPPVAPASATATGGYDYNAFLRSIGIDPASTQFSGGTMSNADIMDSINGGTDWAKLFGGGIGGLLGAVGANRKPAGYRTEVQDIADWLKPYVIGNLGGATGARSNITQNNGIQDAATPQYRRTLAGDFLDPSANPNLDATYKHDAGLVGAGVDSRFESAGRYGSGAHQGALQEGLGNLATSVYGGNYQAERSRQNAAMGFAPLYDIDTARAAFEPFTQFKKLTTFKDVGSQSEPFYTNPVAGILSGGATGFNLMKALGGG